MTSPFAWFDLSSEDASASIEFLTDMFGWSASPMGPATALTQPDAKMPFAATINKSDDVSGWLPYVPVPDVDAATEKALGLGARLLRTRTTGPAGDYSVIEAPGGAQLALWTRA